MVDNLMTKGEFNTFRTGEFNDFRIEFNELKSDFKGLKSEVGELRSEVNELRSEVGEFKESVFELYDRQREEYQRYLGAVVEDLKSQIQGVAEGIMMHVEQSERRWQENNKRHENAEWRINKLEVVRI